MASTGTKAKQIANVLRKNRESGMTIAEATRIVTQHRKEGKAIGGYTVKSKGLHPMRRARKLADQEAKVYPAKDKPNTKPYRTGKAKPGKPTPGKTVAYSPGLLHPGDEAYMGKDGKVYVRRAGMTGSRGGARVS